MSRAFHRIPIAFLVLCLGAVPAMSQGEPKLLETETYLEMESIRSPNISPDGRFVLFTRGSVEKMKDRNRSNLLLVDIEGTRIRELTNGTFRVSSPTWSPDGKRIAFLSERNGTNQIHMMSLDTREVVRLTNLDRAPRRAPRHRIGR